MAELSAVPFSALPQADDGYTVLYENNQVCRSEKKLSELVGDKTSSFLTKEQGDSLYQEKGDYLVNDDITGKLDKSQYAEDSATFLTAHQDISNKLDTTAFSTVSGDFLTAHQSLDEYATIEWVNNQGFLKEHQPISANEWNDVYETVVTNSGTWGTESDWTDDINAASAYVLSEAKDWVEEQNYITGVDLTNYYTKTETSGASEISEALATKQDTLTFDGTNNTITSINNSAIGGGGNTTGEYVPLSATACSIGNNTATAPQSFSQGLNNQCLGTESFTQGYGNSAYNGALAQGRNCYASNYSIAQGNDCSALETANQAFGRGTVISSVGMAIGQYNKTSANVAFVIGNGDASNRSDLFVIDKYGNVSAKKGYFYDKDGKVGGGVGSVGGDYVPLNALECTIGSGNSSISGSLAQGENNLAGRIVVHQATTIEDEFIPEYSEVQGYSFAQGKENSAYKYSITQGNHNEASDGAMAQGYDNKASECSMAQGYHNVANYFSMAQGNYNSAYQISFAQGEYNYVSETGADFGTRNSAIRYSFTQGETVSAKNYSFAAGKYNYAENYSQTFGYGLKATNYTTAQGYEYSIINYGSFVIGEFNKTSAAPFVIGNGTSDNDRRDLFVVDKDGNVSAQGQIYAEGGVLGASLDTLELAPDNETIEFVTSSHNVVNGEGEPEEYTVIKIKTSLLEKINELYNLVSSNSGNSQWVLPQ